MINQLIESEQNLNKKIGSLPKMLKSTAEEKREDKSVAGYRSGYIQWTKMNGCYFPAGPTQNKLIAGFYEINQDMDGGLFFNPIPVNTEELIKFPDTVGDMVMSEVANFWTKQDRYIKFGFPYKRGMLLYGPAGGGKSSVLRLLAKDIIKQDGIVINVKSVKTFKYGMRALRAIEPNRKVIALMEDLDDLIYYEEAELTNILDGIEQINNIVILATTNYPEDLGARIINRPGRFDRKFEIGFLSATARKMYFEKTIPQELLSTIELDKWVADTEMFSIAHMKELITAVLIIGDPYDQAIKLLQEMNRGVR